MASRLEDDDFELQETGRHSTAHSTENLEDTVRTQKTIGEKFLSKFKICNNIYCILIVLAILMVMGAFLAFAGVLFMRERSCGEVLEHYNKYVQVSLDQTTTYTSVKSDYGSAIEKLKKAATIMDEIYLEQMYKENHELKNELLSTACNGKPVALFNLNFGPWVRINDDERFINAPYEFLAEKPGFEIPERKLPGAGFYPENVTESEMREWINSLDEAERKEANSFYTVIEEEAPQHYKAVKYSQEYAKKLAKASTYLLEAVKLLPAKEVALKNFLTLRAAAFTSNDYEASDIAWLNVTDSSSMLEVTIGPYETYDDELLGLKAAFEAYIGYKDSDSTKTIDAILNNLQTLENNLPMDEKYGKRSVGAVNSIRVINQIYAAGQANGAVKAVAYTLPNQETIIENYGSKRILLKNVQKAKFTNILSPIAKLVVSSSQISAVVFDAFFTQVLAHEIMHGLGPQKVIENGVETQKTIREALGKHYSPIEEAKADLGGLWLLCYMLDNDLISLDFGLSSTDPTAPTKILAKRALYATFVGGIFRSVRFGVNASAHAKANALIFNYFRKKGAILSETVVSTRSAGESSSDEPSVLYSVDTDAFEDAVDELLGNILNIQASGNMTGAEELLNDYGKTSDEIKAVLAIFTALEEEEKGIPVDLILKQDTVTVTDDSTTTTSQKRFNYRSLIARARLF